MFHSKFSVIFSNRFISTLYVSIFWNQDVYRATSKIDFKGKVFFALPSALHDVQTAFWTFFAHIPSISSGDGGQPSISCIINQHGTFNKLASYMLPFLWLPLKRCCLKNVANVILLGRFSKTCHKQTNLGAIRTGKKMKTPPHFAMVFDCTQNKQRQRAFEPKCKSCQFNTISSITSRLFKWRSRRQWKSRRWWWKSRWRWWQRRQTDCKD